MGAVSGLSDRDEDGVAGLMIQASGYLPDVNLKLAVESLTRDERRSLELLDAISNSKFSAAARKQLNESALLQHSSERVRLQAAEVLK
jgi:Mg2+/Co2+ transporter CorC